MLRVFTHVHSLRVPCDGRSTTPRLFPHIVVSWLLNVGIASFVLRNQIVTTGAANVSSGRRSGARSEPLPMIRWIGHLDTVFNEDNIVIIDGVHNLLGI